MSHYTRRVAKPGGGYRYFYDDKHEHGHYSVEKEGSTWRAKYHEGGAEAGQVIGHGGDTDIEPVTRSVIGDQHKTQAHAEGAVEEHATRIVAEKTGKHGNLSKPGVAKKVAGYLRNKAKTAANRTAYEAMALMADSAAAGHDKERALSRYSAHLQTRTASGPAPETAWNTVAGFADSYVKNTPSEAKKSLTHQEPDMSRIAFALALARGEVPPEALRKGDDPFDPEEKDDETEEEEEENNAEKDDETDEAEKADDASGVIAAETPVDGAEGGGGGMMKALVERLRKSDHPKDKRVSAKVKLLMDEGKPQDQAVAIALDMERRGDLTKGFSVASEDWDPNMAPPDQPLRKGLTDLSMGDHRGVRPGLFEGMKERALKKGAGDLDLRAIGSGFDPRWNGDDGYGNGAE